MLYCKVAGSEDGPISDRQIHPHIKIDDWVLRMQRHVQCVEGRPLSKQTQCVRNQNIYSFFFIFIYFLSIYIYRLNIAEHLMVRRGVTKLSVRVTKFRCW